MRLDFQTELAPDLEWMLQSGQVPQEVLLQTLLQEHYAPVYHLALSLLDDESAAKRAARQTFTSALLEMHAYRGPNGMRPWLYPIAFRACRAELQKLERRRAVLASLPFSKRIHEFGISLPENKFDAALWLAIDRIQEEKRLALLLFDLHHWSIEDIALVLHSNSQATQDTLRQARLEVLTSAWADRNNAPTTSSAGEAISSESIIQRSLARRWKMREISQEEIDHAFSQVNHRIGGAARRRKGLTHLREWSFVLIAGLASITILWGASQVESEIAETSVQATIVAVTPSLGDQPSTATTPQPAHRRTARPPLEFETLPSWAFYSIKAEDLAAPRVEALERIAVQLGVSLESLIEFNRLLPSSDLQPGQLLAIPGRIASAQLRRATPVTPVLRLPPLDEFSTAQEVRQRLRLETDLYHTLWLDATLVDYGPSTYYGSPRRTRLQAWLGENQTLVLTGRSGSPSPELAMIFLTEANRLFLARPSAGQPWYIEWAAEELAADPQTAQIDFILRNILEGGQFEPTSGLRIMGNQDVAGRNTLVVKAVDWKEGLEGIFWLDDSANLILRKQFYDPLDADWPLREITVNQIAYDIDFPQEFFDPNLPWRGGYASDSSGSPEPNPPSQAEDDRRPFPSGSEPARQGFDARSSRLSFEYPAGFNPYEDGRALTRLYAGNALLGELVFGNPWTMLCDRSPNGRYLAFVPDPASTDAANHALRVVDLLDPELHEVLYLKDYLVTELTISPTNFFLAFFARPREGNKTGQGLVGIMDLGNGVAKPLFQVYAARSLAWNPIGNELFAIVKYEPDSKLEIVNIVNVESSGTIYNGPFEGRPGEPANAPYWDWGIQLPAQTGRFSDCARMP
jgi:DNA-directed RNA polymerase specialized sigma24 family protein